MTTTAKKRRRHPGGHVAGRSCRCGVCHAHPSPDPLGRRHCVHCGCFTADPNRIHNWCRPITERLRFWRPG